MTLYSLSDLKVLVVEDNQFMRTLLVERLIPLSQVTRVFGNFGGAGWPPNRKSSQIAPSEAFHGPCEAKVKKNFPRRPCYLMAARRTWDNGISLLVDALNAMSIGSVSAANSGKRALNLMSNNSYDLVITDLEMENGTGIELIEAIRKGQNIEDPLVPIIVLSANTTRSMITSARDAGTTEFLAKPVSAKALYRRISTIIETPRNFIRTDDYFGPDRRRRQDPTYKGPKRRKDD